MNKRILKIIGLSCLAVVLTFVSCNLPNWVSPKDPVEELQKADKQVSEEKSLKEAIEEAKKAEEAVTQKEAIERLQSNKEAFPPRIVQRSDQRAKTQKPVIKKPKRTIDHYEDRKVKEAGCEKVGVTIQYLGDPVRLVGCKDKIQKITGKSVIESLEVLVNE